MTTNSVYDFQARKLVIAHPMDSYHPAQGGGIRYLMNILNFSSTGNWKPLVIGVRSTDLSAYEENWHQIALIHELPHPLFNLIPNWARYLVALYSKLPFIQIPKDAVIITHRMDCMLAFVLFKHQTTKVLISAAPAYYLRLGHPLIYRYFGWLYHMAEKICVYGVDRIVPTDERTRDYYVLRYPQSQLADCIPAPVNITKFPLLSMDDARTRLNWVFSDPVILFAGRLAYVKNIPLLIRAFKIVLEHIPNARLVIVGDGEERGSIEELVLQVSERIFLVGAIPPSEMYIYYAASDVCVLCSREEGSPTVVKEALACGIPIVSTDVGDVSKTLRSNSTLGEITSATSEDLGRAIYEQLSMARENLQIKKDIRRKAVQDFDVTHVNKRLFMVIDSALSKRQG
jgi:L-malate glycosyltransferase